MDVETLINVRVHANLKCAEEGVPAGLPWQQWLFE